MVTREDELEELALDIKTAIAKARQLNLPTSAYILSMVLVEVSEAMNAAADNWEDDWARERFCASIRIFAGEPERRSVCASAGRQFRSTLTTRPFSIASASRPCF